MDVSVITMDFSGITIDFSDVTTDFRNPNYGQKKSLLQPVEKTGCRRGKIISEFYQMPKEARTASTFFSASALALA